MTVPIMIRIIPANLKVDNFSPNSFHPRIRTRTCPKELIIETSLYAIFCIAKITSSVDNNSIIYAIITSTFKYSITTLRLTLSELCFKSIWENDAITTAIIKAKKLIFQVIANQYHPAQHN